MPTSLTIKEAAEHFNISESTVRRRIKDGTLTAFKQPTTQGYEWRVRIVDTGDQPPMQNDEQVLTDDDQVLTNGEQVVTVDREVITTVEQVATTQAAAPGELVQELRRLHDQNLQLAGQVGYLQRQLHEAHEQIKLLTVTKEEPGPEPEPEQQHAEQALTKRVPWYKRWFTEI